MIINLPVRHYTKLVHEVHFILLSQSSETITPVTLQLS